MVDTNFDTKVRLRADVTDAVRRRRWSDDAKGRIVSDAIAPGAVIADVARRHDLTPQQLSNWIRAAKDGDFVLPADVSFVPAVVEAPEPRSAAVPRGNISAASVEPGTIEVAINGVTVRVGRGAEARTIAAVIGALKAGT